MKKFISYLLFYLIQLTWGCLYNIFGLVVFIFMILTGHKPHRFGPNFYFVCKKLEGFGFEAGICFVIGRDCEEDEYIITHEAGHGIQNMLFGPLFPFIVAIPSMIRYWYRELKYYKKGREPKTDYDDIWFEHQASNWGWKHYIDLFDRTASKYRNL